jgi:hypothetical protein
MSIKQIREEVKSKYSYNHNKGLLENVKQLGDRFPELEKHPDTLYSFWNEDDYQTIDENGELIDVPVLPPFHETIKPLFKWDEKPVHTWNHITEYAATFVGVSSSYFAFAVLIGPNDYIVDSESYVATTRPEFHEIRGGPTDFVGDDSLSDEEFAFYNLAIWLHALENEVDFNMTDSINYLENDRQPWAELNYTREQVDELEDRACNPEHYEDDEDEDEVA